MKILPTNLSQIAFKGYRPIKDNYGRNDYEFSYPFDENHYDCYLELFSVGKDKNGNYYVTDIIRNSETPDGSLKLHSGANKVNLRTDYFLKNDTPFAYHYKLVKKGTDLPIYRTDAGDVINETNKGAHEVYNYVVPNGSKMSHGGSMKLIIPDNYNVGYSYNPVLFTKNNILSCFSIFCNNVEITSVFILLSADNINFICRNEISGTFVQIVVLIVI